MSFVHRIDELVNESGNGLTDKAKHWERVPLELIAEVINGFPFPSGGFNNEKIGDAVIRIRDVTSGEISTYFKGDATDAPRVGHGDLVIGMDGDFNSRLWLAESALMNQRVCKVVPDERFYSKRLLAYAIPGYLKLVNDHTSAVTVKHLSSRTVQDVPLPLPPRAEQDRLASKLDELFSRIDEGERALEQVSKLVERYRQSVLKAAVTGELTRDWRAARKARGEPVESGEALLTRILTARRQVWEQAELEKMKAKGIQPANDNWKKKYKEPAPPDTTELPELPEGWVWVSIAQIGESVTGSTPSKSNPSYFGGSVPFFKPTDLDSGYNVRDFRESLTEDGVAVARLLPEKAVLVTCIGATIGKTGLARVSCVTNQQINALVVDKCSMIPEYAYWYLSSPFGQAAIIGSASATTLPILNKSRFESLVVPVPPLNEQVIIIDEIEKSISRGERLVKEMSTSRHYAGAFRQAIFKSAFSGQLVPQDPTDEPAATLLERIAAERATASADAPKRGHRKKSA